MKIILTLFYILLINYSIYAQVPNWEFLGLKDTVITDIAFDDSGNIFIVSQPTAVYKSTDNGIIFKPKTNGITASNGTAIDIDSKGNIYLTAYGGVFKTTNGGENWFRIALEVNNLEFYTVKVLPNDYIVISNFDGIYRSTDYGATWEATDYNYWGAWEIGINTNGILFVGNFSASWFSIYRSTNFGKNWIFSSRLPAQTLLFSKNGDVFAGVGNNPLFDSDIYKSTDDGLTWNRTNAFITSKQFSYKDFELDINNDFYAIVSGNYNGVYFSADTGKSWLYHGLSDYAGSLSCLAIDSGGYVYAGTHRDGVFRSAGCNTPVELISFAEEVNKDNIILNWVTATETNNYGFEIEKKESKKDWIKIGFVQGKGTSSGKNIYNFKDENINVGENFYRLKQIDYDVSYEYSSELKVTIQNKYNIRLEQNFPNPFNPTTTIKYALPNTSSVTITVYNTLGQIVKVFYEGVKEAGYYSVNFTGEDLSSGVYLYSINAIYANGRQNFNATKKMLLIK